MSKLRFYDNPENDHSYIVKARRKDTGEWQRIGICHKASKKFLLKDLARVRDLVKFD